MLSMLPYELGQNSHISTEESQALQPDVEEGVVTCNNRQLRRIGFLYDIYETMNTPPVPPPFNIGGKGW